SADTARSSSTKWSSTRTCIGSATSEAPRASSSVWPSKSAEADRTMGTAVIGATGHIGSEIVRGLIARGDAVAALVRDHDAARRVFGEPDGLHIRPTRLDDPSDVAEAFRGIRTVFIAMGSVGIQGVLQRIVINVAAGISSIEQVTRLSVLNTSADSLGINQR